MNRQIEKRSAPQIQTVKPEGAFSSYQRPPLASSSSTFWRGQRLLHRQRADL